MTQESIKGWGGAREGGGRKAGVPLGGGEVKAVAVRVGTDLLEQLRQRWPDLTTDSDLIRAAMWEATKVAQESVKVNSRQEVEELLKYCETLGIDDVLSGTRSKTPEIELEKYFVAINKDEVLIEKVKSAGYMERISRMIPIIRQERMAY